MSDAAANLRRLGYGPEARLLIIHGDDLGMCHSESAATFDALERRQMRLALIAGLQYLPAQAHGQGTSMEAEVTGIEPA